MQVTRYSDDVIQAQRTHVDIVHRALMISIRNLHPVCAVNVLLIKEQIWIIFQTVVLASNNFMTL